MTRESEDPIVTLSRKGGSYIRPDYRAVRREFNLWVCGDGPSGLCYNDSVESSPVYRRFNHSLAPVIRGKDISEVLDVGCGTGLAGKSFVEKGIPVDGIDLSLSMLEQAARLGYRSVIEADITSDNPGLSKKYPLVISVGVFGDYVPVEEGLQCMIGFAGTCSVLGFTSARSTTPKRPIKNLLRDAYFTIQLFDLNPAFDGPGLKTMHAYYVIASRQQEPQKTKK